MWYTGIPMDQRWKMEQFMSPNHKLSIPKGQSLSSMNVKGARKKCTSKTQTKFTVRRKVVCVIHGVPD